jgi:hypothetical protein
MQNQFRVRKGAIRFPPGSLHLGNQFRPIIEPRIRRNPILTFEAGRLLFDRGFPGRPQHCVRQAHRPIQPDPARIRSTKSHGIYKALQERPLDGLTVPMKNAGDPAQSLRLSV